MDGERVVGKRSSEFDGFFGTAVNSQLFSDTWEIGVTFLVSVVAERRQSSRQEVVCKRSRGVERCAGRGGEQHRYTADF